MFSWLFKLGCLALVLAAGALAWFTREAWYPRLRARIVASPPPASEATWEPLTAEAAARGRAAFARLTEPHGAVYVNVAAGDFAAFVLDSVLQRLAAGASDVAALARDDRLYLRGRVRVLDLGGAKTLGPLSGVIGGRQELTVGGRLEVLKPERAAFRVDEIVLKELRLPVAVIPRLVARVGAKDRDTTIGPEAIPFRVPRALADLRVARGRVTLYKNVP